MQRFLILLLCFSTQLFGNQLVDIKSVAPKISVQNVCLIPYGYEADNPCHEKPIYLDEYAAIRLKRVSEDLREQGLGLIVYAGYRSPFVQEWVASKMKDAPAEEIEKDAAHYRKGLGVDVALYYLNGQNLGLPSFYGERSLRACRDYPCNPPVVYHHCQLLETYMRKHGFISYSENWWHFDLKGWEEAPNLDIQI